MTDHINTYPDLVNVEDWLNAKGYTGEAGACHAAMSLIRRQEARIAELKAALKPFADVANYFDNEPRYTDEDSPCEAFNTFGDLRAARAAYKGEKE
jgi:hypothetical protein